MKIGVKLTLAFFSIAFISVMATGIISYRKGKQALEEESFNRLTAVRELKSNQIEDYFSQIKDQAISFSHDPTVIRAMKRFKKGFDEYTEDETRESKKVAVANYIKKEFLPRLNANSDKPID